MTGPTARRLVSDACRDYLHAKCSGCAGCTCHPEQERREEVLAFAGEVDSERIHPADVLDLLAHLRTVYGHHVPASVPVDESAAAVRCVIELGWRPMS